MAEGNIDGIIYLLNQAGLALSQVSQQNEALVEQNKTLQDALGERTPEEPAATDS